MSKEIASFLAARDSRHRDRSHSERRVVFLDHR